MGTSEKAPSEARSSHDIKRAVETKVVGGNAAFNEAMLKEPPNPWTKHAMFLFAASLVGFFCSTMNGYDGSLYNSMLANETFLNCMNGSNKGIWAGIVSSMYQIGGIAALPFISPVADGFGRKVGMFTGSVIIVIGTIISAVLKGPNVGQFMGGRFVLGFGVSIASAAGPIILSGMFTGSILPSGVALGSLNLSGNQSWLVPLWLQLLFSGLIILFVFFLPESPRWFYVHNKTDQAKAVLTKYHGEGNPDSAWVQLQLAEYEEHLEVNGLNKGIFDLSMFDYRPVFSTKIRCYRVFCSCCISIFGQWAGNSVLSYFMSAVLDSAGVFGDVAKNNVILINNCQQFAWALFGATLVDRFGRRPLLLFANIGCSLVWMCITITSSEFAKHGDTATDPGTSPAAGTATLAFIFVFGAVFSVGFSPLQALYPVEVLSFEMRAKGMAFQNLAMNAAMLLNQFAWPVSMDKIMWRTYIIFCIWCAIQATVIFFFIPETKNCTLEEVDQIFNHPNPVKYSIQKHKLGIRADGDVVELVES